MEKVLRDKKAICFFILPALVLYTVIVIYPIGVSTYYSMVNWNGIGNKDWIGLTNYKDLFGDTIFIKAVINSVVLVILSLVIQLPIAMVLALVISSGIKGEGFFRTVYFIPVILSTVVIGQLWMQMYHPNYGFINNFLKTVGLEQWARPWLGDKKTALGSVFVPIIWQYIGYHMLLFYSAINTISKELKEAAKIDGATNTQLSWHILIPLIKPMIKTSIIFSVIGSIKAFDQIYVITNGGPLHATEVPSTYMYNTIFHRYRYGYGSSMAVMIILECLLFTLLIKKLIKTNTEG